MVGFYFSSDGCSSYVFVTGVGGLLVFFPKFSQFSKVLSADPQRCSVC